MHFLSHYKEMGCVTPHAVRDIWTRSTKSNQKSIMKSKFNNTSSQTQKTKEHKLFSIPLVD